MFGKKGKKFDLKVECSLGKLFHCYVLQIGIRHF